MSRSGIVGARECVVCGGTTTMTQLEQDVCSACTIFYRLNLGTQTVRCRTNTHDCSIGVYCRQCRLEQIERILMQPLRAASEGTDSESSSMSSPKFMNKDFNLISNRSRVF